MSPVFIWQPEPTWFSPSAQQERMTVMSCTCCAIFGSQSDTEMPLCPYCLNERLVGINALLAVPIAVITFPNDSGIGWPASLARAGFVSNKSRWLGPPSMNGQIIDFARVGKCGGRGDSGFSGSILRFD